MGRERDHWDDIKVLIKPCADFMVDTTYRQIPLINFGDSDKRMIEISMHAINISYQDNSDPIAPQSDLRSFELEMNKAGIDWQTHLYGNAMHAFATPDANDPASAILYNPTAASRAWTAIHHFLDEIFSGK